MVTNSSHCLTMYLKGERLYGDDLTESEIEEWYRDEAEAYAQLGSGDRQNYCYGYHALNKLLGYSYVGTAKFDHVVGLGSAYGDEFLPIIDRVSRLSILDPSDTFKVANIEGVPVAYDKPNVTGDLPFETASINLITCFGVLHHIPNVSHVVREFARCLAPGGIVLIREPTVSMGDWAKPRTGLTKRERGIPLQIFQEIIYDAKLDVVKGTSFGFSPLTYVWNRISPSSIYNSSLAVMLDIMFCRLTKWNYRYHRQTVLERFAPSSVFWVLTKSSSRK